MSEYKRKPNIACNICQTPIYRRPGILEKNGGNAYCSQLCFGKASRKEHPCIVCGAPILAGANKKTCTRACSNINRTGIKYTGRQLKDNVKTQRRLKVRLLSARGNACERCSYALCQVLQVHHKNRNNNKLQNLELLCPNCHAEEHYVKN